MKNATIRYFVKDYEYLTGLKNSQIIESKDIIETIFHIFNKGLNVMLYHLNENEMIIFIDNLRFQQR